MENEIEVVRAEVTNVGQWVNGLVVANAEDYTATYARISVIKGFRSRWVDLWAKTKANTYATWKGVVAEEKKITDICDFAEKMAKRKADDWKQAVEAKAAAEQARLQAIENEKFRREQQAAIKAAEKLKSPELKAARLEEAEQIRPPEITIESEAPKIKGVSHSVTVKARLVDMAALIAAATPGSIASTFLIFDQSGANRATSTKNKVPVPGIEYYEERSSAVRSE